MQPAGRLEHPLECNLEPFWPVWMLPPRDSPIPLLNHHWKPRSKGCFFRSREVPWNQRWKLRIQAAWKEFLLSVPLRRFRGLCHDRCSLTVQAAFSSKGST